MTDSPSLWEAWEAYRDTGEYQNTRLWAADIDHVDGSLWAAFAEGFNSSSPSPAIDKAAIDKAVEAVNLAVFDYLVEARSYHYSEDHNPPSPREMGIEWRWQDATPDRPSMMEALRADALEYFTRYVNEMDPEAEPTDWDRQCIAHRAALSAGRSALTGKEKVDGH